MEAYGTPAPPDYDLGKVTCPVALYYGPNDWIGQPQVRTLGFQIEGKFAIQLEAEVSFVRFG